MQQLLEGSKKVEGRINREKWSEMAPGDSVLFNDEYLFLIEDVKYYKDFLAYLVFEGINNTLPGFKSLSDAINLYVKDDDGHGLYSREEIEKYGVVALHLVQI